MPSIKCLDWETTQLKPICVDIFLQDTATKLWGLFTVNRKCKLNKKKTQVNSQIIQRHTLFCTSSNASWSLSYNYKIKCRNIHTKIIKSILCFIFFPDFHWSYQVCYQFKINYIKCFLNSKINLHYDKTLIKDKNCLLTQIQTSNN